MSGIEIVGLLFVCSAATFVFGVAIGVSFRMEEENN